MSRLVPANRKKSSYSSSKSSSSSNSLTSEEKKQKKLEWQEQLRENNIKIEKQNEENKNFISIVKPILDKYKLSNILSCTNNIDIEKDKFYLYANIVGKNVVLPIKYSDIFIDLKDNINKFDKRNPVYNNNNKIYYGYTLPILAILYRIKSPDSRTDYKNNYSSYNNIVEYKGVKYSPNFELSPEDLSANVKCSKSFLTGNKIVINYVPYNPNSDPLLKLSVGGNYRKKRRFHKTNKNNKSRRRQTRRK